jgi:hypothetical protein
LEISFIPPHRRGLSCWDGSWGCITGSIGSEVVPTQAVFRLEWVPLRGTQTAITAPEKARLAGAKVPHSRLRLIIKPVSKRQVSLGHGLDGKGWFEGNGWDLLGGQVYRRFLHCAALRSGREDKCLLVPCDRMQDFSTSPCPCCGVSRAKGGSPRLEGILLIRKALPQGLKAVRFDCLCTG